MLKTLEDQEIFKAYVEIIIVSMGQGLETGLKTIIKRAEIRLPILF